MDDKLKYYLLDLEKNEDGVSDYLLQAFREEIDFEPPEDYVDMMREFNGGEGEVGENGWLVLFPVEELIQTNKDYTLLMSAIPEYFLFGKDAADTGYAFHKNNKTYHEFGLMSNFRTDPIILCGNNLTEFLEYLYNQQ